MQKSLKFILVIAALLTVGAALWGPIMSRVEQPTFKLLSADGNIEVRTYAPQLVAEVSVKGRREEALRQGFKLLAGFIFGNNTPHDKVAMTAPVKQQNYTIAMTAPVKQQVQESAWKISFTMPRKYTLATLPKPVDPVIQLHETATQTFAVIRFSGFHTDSNIATHEQQLLNYVAKHKLSTLGKPVYAFYNPPWTLPFLRRYEVMIEVQQPSKVATEK